MEILPLISLHLGFCSPSYGLFAKTGQVSLFLAFSGQYGSGQFCDQTWANNLDWFKAFLGSVVFIKVVFLYLSFLMV